MRWFSRWRIWRRQQAQHRVQADAYRLLNDEPINLRRYERALRLVTVINACR